MTDQPTRYYTDMIQPHIICNYTLDDMDARDALENDHEMGEVVTVMF